MNEILNQIKKAGIVPVAVVNDIKDAKFLAKTLCDNGLFCVEITFRTLAAEEAIKIIHKEYPKLLVGAGTVLTIEQVDKAVRAGAKFIVSPGCNPKIIKYCVDNNILILPGCANASDIESALEYGVDVVKFFPAELLGGLKMIKALAGPYQRVTFMPTGGITQENVKKYLEYDRVIACGGSWMVKKDLFKRKEYEKIEELIRETVEIVKEKRGTNYEG